MIIQNNPIINREVEKEINVTRRDNVQDFNPSNEIKVDLRKNEDKPKEVEKPQENVFLQHIAPQIAAGNTSDIFKLINSMKT